MQGTWGMFIRIPGNLLEHSGECYQFNISGNVPEDSRECLRRFQGIFEKIPGNVSKDTGECLRRFPANVQEESGSGESKFGFIS